MIFYTDNCLQGFLFFHYFTLGISTVYDVDGESGRETVIELSADIKAKTFVRVLEFLYTGWQKNVLSIESFFWYSHTAEVDIS